MHAVGVGDGWFQLCQDREQWSELYFGAVDILAQNRGTITCANIFQIWNLFSVCVCVVVLSKGRVIYQDIITFVEFSTGYWFRRILRTLLSRYSVLRTAAKVGVYSMWCLRGSNFETG